MFALKKLIACLGIGLLVAGLAVATRRPTETLAANDPDYRAIEEALRLKEAIDTEIQYTLDDSRLSEVYANDARGGAASDDDAQLVRYMLGKPELAAGQIGKLDTLRALYAYQRKVKELYEAAIASGVAASGAAAAPTPEAQDPFINPLPEQLQGNPAYALRAGPASVPPDSIPAIQALMQAAGRQAATLPPPRPETMQPVPFTVKSITVDNDLAHVVVEYLPATAEDLFVKIDGRWYMIGGKIVQWHGG